MRALCRRWHCRTKKLQSAYTRSDGADAIIVVAIAITAYGPIVAMV